jgi:hypothetical protein
MQREQSFMSRDESSMEKPGGVLASGYLLYLLLVPILVLGGIILVLVLAGSTTAPRTNSSGGLKQAEESNLEMARQTLTRQTDLSSCHGALQQINAEWSERSILRPPPLTTEQKDWLREHIHLDEKELAEIESGNCTLLDDHHLDRCFLMRDAARSLEVKGVRGGAEQTGEKPLDQAARAFAWVVRQVRLRERGGEDVPAAFVLRRGWGSAVERALVFLALLEQLGDPSAPNAELIGCMLQVPDDSSRMRFWTCGVVAGDGKDVYLFDPRLGLPLPGPKGQGIATLAEVRKHPEILAQLNGNEKQRYDVTPEQARSAQAQFVCPLSALSPRMRYVQETVLAPAVRVRLAVDPAKALERVTAACAGGADKPTPVRMPREKITLLRHFLPAGEGGSDTGMVMRPGTPPAMSRKDLFEMEMVPWPAFPSQFRNNRNFPLDSDLGRKVQGYFAAPFIRPTLDPGLSRDLLLRGRYSAAEPELVKERERWRDQQKERANAADLERRAGEWVNQAANLYALMLQAAPQEREAAKQRVDAIWRDPSSGPVYTLLFSAVAEARNPEVSYQLGLCSQEQAEQLQARLDLQSRARGAAAEDEKTRQAWQDALSAWKQYEEDYPKHADRAAARLMRGRAEAMLGDWRDAVATWKKPSDSLTDLEKLASLYLAQQLEKQHAK